MNAIQKRKRNSLFLYLLFGALAAVLLLRVGGSGSSEASTKDSSVELGTKNKPYSGSEDNTHPVVPAEFQDWTNVDQFLSQPDSQWYADCLQTRVGVSREQVRQYADLVRKGEVDLRFILVSNSSVSKDEARAMLKARGIKNVDSLPIMRVNGFQNTQGLPEDKCNPFGDGRAQVRVSLAIPLDVNNPKVVDQTKGVLAMCGNPWDTSKEVPFTPPTQPTKPTVPTTPNTTAPPTTTPPSTVPPTTTTLPKPPVSPECMANPNNPGCPTLPVGMEPQDNPGQDTGPTQGAPAQPVTPPTGPPPVLGTPPPPPTQGGTDSGSPSGGGTPGGSEGTPDGTTGGGGPTGPTGPPVPGDDGTYGGDPGL